MLLITFSGLDGSGKSTHVARTADYLSRRGYRVGVLPAARISAGGILVVASHILQRLTPRARQVKKQGTSAQPRCRTYAAGPAVRPGWRQRAVSLTRLIVYPLDCLALFLWIRLLHWRGYTAVVCDRYIYDKMANLPAPNGSLGRLMCRLAPKPRVAFLIDTLPEVARRRREEHDASYYAVKYAGYRQLISTRRELTSIPSTTIEETQEAVERVVDAYIARQPIAFAYRTA